VLWALLIGGIILIAFEKWKKKSSKLEHTEMSVMDCVKVGLFQSIAFIPGVSRSAATILGGMSIGISRSAIVEYSFLLAVPTMLAATGLDAIKNKDLIMHSGNFSALLVGLVVSYVVALFAIKGFLSYIKKSDFVPFGIYRIIIALAFFLFI
jgi:undecaprenyl-diphosphatase